MASTQRTSVEARLERLREQAAAPWSPEAEAELRERLIPALMEASDRLDRAADEYADMRKRQRSEAIQTVLGSTVEGWAFQEALREASSYPEFGPADYTLAM